MGTIKSFAAGIVLATFAAAAPALAGPSFMHTGSPTSQPVGHYEFCQRNKGECDQRTPAGSPVELTRELWATLIEINNSVNLSVVPLTDMEIWGVEERWSYPDAVGDCEDYVLEKRRLLMERNVPAGALLITVVRQPNGDGHAVLTVRTNLGDFVLDNMEPKILAWHDTEYQYLKRQSERHSGTWVSINDDRQMLVGSISK
ncbi:MAG: transglutaminase-like cysteine peptidase [Rhizobiaceae bacterium]|nr:transglutaminase-like cysteine peptidase [Rhizobiaceae bacterium]MCV0408631.1 transglutaminase-like cysteine peptidase [Rhizobiaceae bacterium]